ncbi:carbohydrate-binding module family 14 protein [Streptomyces sp. NBC_00435]|uniref:carbohydrate-binding module family 14 protein n=1 Tax=Streptomyces sp. NBC_00435 TaxID=2903649 RepID=UPI002E1BBD9C
MLRRLAVALGTMVVAVAGFAVPAQAAPAAEPPCQVFRLIPDGTEPASFHQCQPGHLPVVKTCPETTLFDPSTQVCDWPHKIELAATAVKAGTAQLSVLPLGVSNLNATVTWDGLAVPNALVTFTSASGKVLCTAHTDYSGRAACDAGGLLSTVDQLLRGYTATYTGNTSDGGQTLAGSTGKGTIVLL